ncbi:MAG TPA: TIGR03435 family protein [Bryobacteraceae bacterium]|nr:TIGR03435 family protein [Bryobacteraceae bacterium]
MMKTMMLCMAAVALSAQSFEVASVRASPPDTGDRIMINLGTYSHGRLTLTNTTLADCLRFAYGLTSDSQIAGESWIKMKDVHYDIVAKTAPDATREQAAKMLQGLLKERFKIESHWAPHEMSYYALTVGKGGPKLKPAADGDAQFAPRALRYFSQPRLSMPMLATLISRFELRSVVIDETGISGRYNVTLEWSPENAPADAAPGPSIFTAVKEQLGLQLEAKKGPVQVLTIDHAEKVPVEN